MDLQLPGGSSFFEQLFSANTVLDGANSSVSNADETMVRQAFAQLDRGEIEFMILSDGPRFMQVAGDARSGYDLEYNNGSDREQFRAANPRLSGDEVLETLLQYLNHDPAWETALTWNKFKL